MVSSIPHVPLIDDDEFAQYRIDVLILDLMLLNIAGDKLARLSWINSRCGDLASVLVSSANGEK